MTHGTNSHTVFPHVGQTLKLKSQNPNETKESKYHHMDSCHNLLQVQAKESIQTNKYQRTKKDERPKQNLPATS